jgi:NRAMP (natural resistance-associated macrophage protein)-like metal ion transporter
LKRYLSDIWQAAMSTLEDTFDVGKIGQPLKRLSKRLGPGLITGAADDDPSGIGTYSQAGAQLGYGIGWTMLLTYPLMVGIQEISARIGRTTGHGIAGNLSRHYPRWLLQGIVLLLFVANTINIGADLSAMADAAQLLFGGAKIIYVAAFTAVCVLGVVFINYARYALVLKWLTLSLFSYVAAVLAVRVDWTAAMAGTFVPHLAWTRDYFTTLVAILGTTISPYLFFWQASQEAEEIHVKRKRKPLARAAAQAGDAFARIRADTLVGMAFSNVIALAIIISTAATLHRAGVVSIATSSEAAKALEPIAGPFAFGLFALGIVGTGLLAIPVLAGSAAYAVGEARRWTVGLARQPKNAIAFYSVIAAAALMGAGITVSPIDPIKALYWSAVINGVVAPPVMVVMMLMTANRRVMGQFVIGGWLRSLGWVSTTAMSFCVVAMIAFWLA